MIYLGSDHGGFRLKKQIKQWLDEWGLAYRDLGANSLDPEDDYPQYALAVGEAVAGRGQGASGLDEDAETAAHKGILGCRSAAGVVIAANKVRGVRAFAAFTQKSARHARAHNDANVIALSGDWLTDEQAKEILKVFLDTPFSKAPRHARRIGQIREYEELKVPAERDPAPRDKAQILNGKSNPKFK